MADAPLPVPPDGIAPELPDGATPADLDAVQASWEVSLAALLADWDGIDAGWKASLAGQVRGHVAASDVVALSGIHVDSRDGARALEDAMAALRADAAAGVVAEALAQDVVVHAGPPDVVWLAAVAQVWAAVLAGFLAASAVREALRVWPARQGGDAEGARVAELVAVHLDELTDAQPRQVLGGALTAAQHDGRVRTALSGPDAAIYADEVLDTNTCAKCRKINRKWLGNSTSDAAQILALYPVQGYVECLGGVRCRGQVVMVWRGGTNWREWVELPAQRGDQA